VHGSVEGRLFLFSCPWSVFNYIFIDFAEAKKKEVVFLLSSSAGLLKNIKRILMKLCEGVVVGPKDEVFTFWG